MSTPKSFPERLRELRDQRGFSAENLARRLKQQAPVQWPHTPSAGRSRIANFENGRAGNITRGECAALEQVLGAGPDELWRLALLDDRKVDPEVRAYYEARLEEALAHQTGLNEDERALINVLRGLPTLFDLNEVGNPEMGWWGPLEDYADWHYVPALRDYGVLVSKLWAAHPAHPAQRSPEADRDTTGNGTGSLYGALSLLAELPTAIAEELISGLHANASAAATALRWTHRKKD